MPYRIAILSAWYPNLLTPAGGVFVQAQAEALATRHQVCVLSLTLEGLKNTICGPHVPELGVSDEQGLRVFRGRYAWAMPYLPKLYLRGYRKHLRQAWEAMVADWGKPDLIHAHVAWPMGVAALEIARSAGIPMVLTEHFGPLRDIMGQALVREKSSEVYREVDRLLAVSPNHARDLQFVCPQARPEVLGNMVNADFFVPATSRDEGPPRFFALGRLVSGKGFSVLLDACAELRERSGRDFELCLGGAGPERSALEAQAARLGLPCRFAGNLDRESVLRELQHCDAFIHPSFAETFGVVLLEAMSCGKPAIATRCGGPEYIVTHDTGLLVPPHDASALADAMEAYLAQPGRFSPATIRESAIERFGKDAVIDHLDDLYHQLLA